MNAKTKDILSSLFWLLFSAYVAFESYHFGLGEWAMPGPGYFPFGAALLVGMVSFYFLFKTLQNHPAPEIVITHPKIPWKNVVSSLVSMLVYAILLNTLGFLFSTILLMAFLLRVVANKRWVPTLIIALSITLGAHLLFNTLLNVQLPTGILPF